MAILYKVTAAGGKYKDSEGNEKTRYVDMGVVMETKNGPMLKLEAIPVGWDGWAYLNDPKPRDGERPQQGNTSSARRPPRVEKTDGFEDQDIPFISNRHTF